MQRQFNHFHLSSKFLGEPYFQFTPRIPSEPYIDADGNTIEDNFTKRVSLAKTIDDARMAIKDYGKTHYYIYATQTDNNIIQVKDNIPTCPKNPPKKYGVKFNLINWLKKNEPEEIKNAENEEGSIHSLTPADLSPKVKDEFKGCVPDANITDEEWKLKPLNMLFVGTISDTGDIVQLSQDGAQVMTPKTF